MPRNWSTSVREFRLRNGRIEAALVYPTTGSVPLRALLSVRLTDVLLVSVVPPKTTFNGSVA